MKELDKIDINELLIKTEAFMGKMYWVKEDFNMQPKKEHIGTCIKYNDLKQMAEEFVNEMIATVTGYVYAKSHQNKLVKTFEEGRDTSGAHEMLSMRAKEKFRKNNVKGQFSELLLFVFLQHFFKAAPLLRKMRITDDPSFERHGADAIHIAKNGDKWILYIGEAKTYDRAKNSFKDAVKDAIEGVVEHYDKHTKDLSLYVYEEFIPEELEKIAQNYVEGKLSGVEVHLVCMVSYKNEHSITGTSEKELIENTIETIRKDTATLKEDLFKKIPTALLPRMNYILFPMSGIDALVNSFNKKLG
jgi:hypothetical protein